MKNNLQKFYKPIFWLALIGVIFFTLQASAQAQNDAQVVDKTVATVSDGVRTELITYSDLLWNLALKPDVPIDPPTSDDLNLALQELIKFRLVILEAERLPTEEPTPEEIKAEIERILAQFPSTAEFVRRLNLVGFDSISDENFQELMRQRVAIEKYIDFRFRSFVVITPEDERKYYREVFTPDFRRRNPGLLLPQFEEVQARINETLTEQKVAADIEKFLDNAEARADIVILSEV
jgi:hypothetical protein